MDLLRSALKEVPAALVSFIKIFCIPDVQFPHKCGNAIFYTFGKQEMIVVFHQAPAVDINNSFL